jgi:hypothetical protein
MTSTNDNDPFSDASGKMFLQLYNKMHKKTSKLFCVDTFSFGESCQDLVQTLSIVHLDDDKAYQDYVDSGGHLEFNPSLEWMWKSMIFFGNMNQKSNNNLGTSQVRKYTSNGYKEMNNHLRNQPRSESYNAMRSLIQQAPMLTPSNQEIIVWRYVRSNGFDEHATTIQCDGFLSTTIDPRCMADLDLNSIILKIHIISPTCALWIPGVEREVIFDHGHTLTVFNTLSQKFVCREESQTHTVLECTLNPTQY